MAHKNCVFCQIVNGEIPTHKEYETDNFIVFKDIKPSAPIHLLIVPKTHISDLSACDNHLWNEIKEIALTLQNKFKLDGFRLATNVGTAAVINHMHVHFLAGITKTRNV